MAPAFNKRHSACLNRVLTMSMQVLSASPSPTGNLRFLRRSQRIPSLPASRWPSRLRRLQVGDELSGPPEVQLLLDPLPVRSRPASKQALRRLHIREHVTDRGGKSLSVRARLNRRNSRSMRPRRTGAASALDRVSCSEAREKRLRAPASPESHETGFRHARRNAELSIHTKLAADMRMALFSLRNSGSSVFPFNSVRTRERNPSKSGSGTESSRIDEKLYLSSDRAINSFIISLVPP